MVRVESMFEPGDVVKKITKHKRGVHGCLYVRVRPSTRRDKGRTGPLVVPPLAYYYL